MSNYSYLDNLIFEYTGTKTTVAVNANNTFFDITDANILTKLNDLDTLSKFESCNLVKAAYQDYASKLNKYNAPVPIVLRACIYRIVWKELKKIQPNTLEKVTKEGKGLEEEVRILCGMQKKIYERWKIYPYKEYRNLIYKPPYLRLARLGKKREDLCFVVNELTNSLPVKSFVDVFGGLGSITTTMRPKLMEVYNEADPLVFNFLLMLKWHHEVLFDKLRNLHSKIYDLTDESILAIGEDQYNKKTNNRSSDDCFSGKAKNFDTDKDILIKILGYYKSLEELNHGYSKDMSERQWEYREGVSKLRYEDTLKDISAADYAYAFKNKDYALLEQRMGRFDKDEVEFRCERAMEWFFVHSFSTAGLNKAGESGISSENYIKFLKSLGCINADKERNYELSSWGFISGTGIQSRSLVFEGLPEELHNFSKRLQNVTLSNSDFRDVFDSMNNRYVLSDNQIVNERPVILNKLFTDKEIKSLIVNGVITEHDFLHAIDIDIYNKLGLTDISMLGRTLVKDKRSIKDSPTKRVYYLDQPYFLTEQYSVVFTDMDHRDLQNYCKQTESYWIMSCKSRPTNKIIYTARKELEKRGSIRFDNMYDYYRGFKYTTDIVGSRIAINDAVIEHDNLWVLQYENADNVSEMFILNYKPDSLPDLNKCINSCKRTQKFINPNSTLVLKSYNQFLEELEVEEKEFFKRAI